MQFFRNRLRQRRTDVLSKLDLSRVHNDRSVLIDMYPCPNLLRHFTIESPPGLAFLLLREQMTHRHQQRYAGAEHFQKLAPIKLEVIKRIFGELISFDFS